MQLKSSRNLFDDDRSGAQITVNDAVSIQNEKMKYGALLPKSGVYFLPDEKVVIFLRIMRAFQDKCERSQLYHLVNNNKEIINTYRHNEEQRLIHNMKIGQIKELANLEYQH